MPHLGFTIGDATMRHALPHLLAAAFLAVTLPLAAYAQQTDSKGGTATDAGFVTNASGAGIAEVKLSELAATNASSAQVKRFAQHMITDHTKAGDELKSLAGGERGYATADSPPPAAQKDIDALSRLKGADFDKEYAKIMVTDHEKAVAIFEVEVEKGSNKELQVFAKKTLPTLKEHLKMAKTLP
jgi:putative membrane protein